MKCPDCQHELQVERLKGINIHGCSKCNGKWLERGELTLAMSKADDGLMWLDFEPFGKDTEQLSVISAGKQCPKCLKEMQSLTYRQSKVVIDKCPSCEGVWLNYGEFEKIIPYLEKVIDTKFVKDLDKGTFREFINIFSDHKGIVSEVKDFLAVLNILEIRIAVDHPHLAQSWRNIESISPFK